jgi:molybdopterin/thiamine biosynthesis adenylyltransferase
LNRQAVQQSKPMVECAVYALEAHITTILPGRTPCLACLCPQKPAAWRRRFPVLGAVPAMVGALAALEIIKLVTGLGEPLLGRLLTCDLRRMTFRTLSVRRDPACPVCGRPARRAA